MKLGDTVIYNSNTGRQVAIVTQLNPDQTINLAAWDGNAFNAKNDVPRNDDGLGHTYTPVGAQ